MHELSIASALMEQVVAEAEANHLTRVDTVEIHTGALRQIIAEVMQEAFREVRDGTPAQEAELIMKEVPAEAQCRQCRKTFEPDVDCFLCPSCHKADVDILKGNEIVLMAINGS